MDVFNHLCLDLGYTMLVNEAKGVWFRVDRYSKTIKVTHIFNLPGAQTRIFQ